MGRLLLVNLIAVVVDLVVVVLGLLVVFVVVDTTVVVSCVVFALVVFRLDQVLTVVHVAWKNGLLNSELEWNSIKIHSVTFCRHLLILFVIAYASVTPPTSRHGSTNVYISPSKLDAVARMRAPTPRSVQLNHAVVGELAEFLF